MTKADREFEAYAKRVLDELVPEIQASAVVASIVPKGETDVKFAVELGLSIMLDKPIRWSGQGVEIPDHLARVADAIVEDGPDLSDRLGDALLLRLSQDPK